MREFSSEPTFSWMTGASMPTDDLTTQYRLSELERSFREFKADWHNSTSNVTSSLATIQNQLTAITVRGEDSKVIEARIKALEDRPNATEMNVRLKTLEERNWQVVLAILVAAIGLVWNALEAASRLPVKLP